MNTHSEESRILRNVYGKFATGVSVVSFLDKDNKPFGLTVNSFTSVSLDPPIALWCVDKWFSMNEICRELLFG